MAETPCGSVHESPVRHLPHARIRKDRKTKFRDWVPGFLNTYRTICAAPTPEIRLLFE